MALLVAVLSGVELSERPQSPLSQAPNRRLEQGARTSSPRGQRGQSFWEHTTSNPDTFFAFWVAAFTTVLALSTVGLWVASKRQSSDMQQLLHAAQDNAAAAASQAAAMTGLRTAAEAQERTMQQQAKAMTAVAEAAQKSADIARRALTELERPLLVVEVPEPGITVDASGKIEFAGLPKWEATNYGRSPAILVDRITNWKVELGGTLPYPVDPTIAKASPFPQGILVDHRRPFSEIHNYMIYLTGFHQLLQPNALLTMRIYFHGFVRYSDLFGGIYVNGFCLMFDHLGIRYVRMGPDTHNYNITEKRPGT